MNAAIMHSMPFPSIFVDKRGQISKANTSALNFIGQVIGCSFHELLQNCLACPGSYHAAYIADAILSQKELLAEYVTLRIQNKPVNFITNTVVAKNEAEEITGVYCSFQQVSRHEHQQSEVMSALSRAIASKCTYTKSHSNRVAHLSTYIGKLLGLSQQQLKHLFSGALLHDIGKIGISEGILNKKSPLTLEEFHRIRQHPGIGYQIIKPVRCLNPLTEIILNHHERYDGKGYPNGLSGENIPLLSRIVSVADAFEAMTYDRNYRKKITFANALTELADNAGTQFDPHVTGTFIKNVQKQRDEKLR